MNKPVNQIQAELLDFLSSFEEPAGQKTVEEIKTLLVDPVLARLGWDLDELHDYNAYINASLKHDPDADYLLPSDNGHVFATVDVVEQSHKYFASSWGIQEWIERRLNYVTLARAEFAIVTCGTKWAILRGCVPGIDYDHRISLTFNSLEELRNHIEDFVLISKKASQRDLLHTRVSESSKSSPPHHYSSTPEDLCYLNKEGMQELWKKCRPSEFPIAENHYLEALTLVLAELRTSDFLGFSIIPFERKYVFATASFAYVDDDEANLLLRTEAPPGIQLSMGKQTPTIPSKNSIWPWANRMPRLAHVGIALRGIGVILQVFGMWWAEKYLRPICATIVGSNLCGYNQLG